MSTPRFDPEQLRAVSRRMAETILAEDPAPYTDGGYVRRVLEVRGRVSGDVVQVPIAVVSAGGGRYLVSPVRRRNWVRNLLADARCTIVSRDGRVECRAVPVDDADTVAEVVGTYLAVMDAPWALRQFPVGPDADRAEIAAAAPGMAVFRLDGLA